MLYQQIMQMDMSALPRLIRQIANDKSEQEKVLMNILEENKDTEFGKRYGFSRIHSIEEFRKIVPISKFDSYIDFIEKIKNGHNDVLFAGAAEQFIATSGTTGKSKIYAESYAGARVKEIVQKMRMVEMMRMVPEALKPEARILTITNSAVYRDKETGITLSTASGAAAAANDMQDKMVLPPCLLLIPGLSNEDLNYLTMLFCVAEKNTAGLVINNLAQFVSNFHYFQEEKNRILQDISNGTLDADLRDEDRELLLKYWKANPARAEELQELLDAEEEISVSQVWPNFSFVCCWTSGSVGRTVSEYKHIFEENVKIIEWGYGASEGKFNIPLQVGAPHGLPASFGYFFEFRPLDGTDLFLLNEVELEKPYNMIITTYSGLYRYDLQDIVVFHDTPMGKTMEFLCKETDSLDCDGHMIYAFRLKDMVEAYEKEHGAFLRLYQGVKEKDGIKLIVESDCDNFSEEDFCEYMRNEFHKLSIPLVGIERKEKGYRDSLFMITNEEGKVIAAQTKIKTFIA